MVHVPAERLYQAFADPDQRERWLPGAAVEIRTARPAKSIRANKLKAFWRERLSALKERLES